MEREIKDKIASKFIIVGGTGHTTNTLRNRVHSEYPFIQTAGLSEAVIFQQYLQNVHDCQADLLETESTNYGNNITYLLSLLDEKCIHFENIIICQDATMQARMDAVLRKYTSSSIRIINYAAYAATVCCSPSDLAYTEKIHGMWAIDRYIELLMGEIPSLTDNENGYGPNGKGFLAHVDISDEVQLAFEQLKTSYGKQVREANPMFASK